MTDLLQDCQAFDERLYKEIKVGGTTMCTTPAFGTSDSRRNDRDLNF